MVKHGFHQCCAQPLTALALRYGHRAEQRRRPIALESRAPDYHAVRFGDEEVRDVFDRAIERQV